MHLARSGAAYHAYDFAARGSAHDRIVNKHDALAFEQMADGIELQLHAEVANRLRRLNERAADIVIPDKSLPVRNARFGSKADSGRHTRVGHGHDNVRIDGMLAS